MLLLAISTMFMTMGQGIVSPILPLLVKSYGMSAVMVGVVVSSFALARVFANIPAGMLARMRGSRFVLALGALFSLLGNLFVGLIPTYTSLVVFRFVAGLGSALFVTAAVIFVAQVSAPDNRGRLMTIFQTFFLLGLSLGPSIGGITADLFGLASPFFLVAVVSAVAGVWALAKIPAGVVPPRQETTMAHVLEQQATLDNTGKRRSALFTRSYLAVSLIAMATFFTRGGTLFNLWPLLGTERFALSPGSLGLLFTVPSLVNLICQPFVGVMADRLRRKALLVPTMFLVSIALLVSAISPVVAVFALAMVLYGIAQAVESPTANSYVADVAPREQQALALGLFRTYGDVGLVLGSPLLGLVADLAGITWALVANAVIVLIPGLFFAVMATEIVRPPALAVEQQD